MNPNDQLPSGCWIGLIVAFIPTGFVSLFVPFYVFFILPGIEWPLDKPILSGDTEKLAKLIKQKPILLHKGVSSGKGHYDWEPIHLAASVGNIPAVEFLLGAGAKVNSRGQFGSAPTPLFIAAREGKVEMVRLLIGKGADINAGERDGRTPLQVAKKRGFIEICDLLVQAGAQMMTQTESPTDIHRGSPTVRPF